jgi:hypothetical protein
VFLCLCVLGVCTCVRDWFCLCVYVFVCFCGCACVSLFVRACVCERERHSGKQGVFVCNPSVKYVLQKKCPGKFREKYSSLTLPRRGKEFRKNYE